MKSYKLVLALVATIACINAFAGTDVAFQKVLSRNGNDNISKGDHDNRVFWSAELKGLAGLRTVTPTDTKKHDRMGNDLTLPRANINMDAVVADYAMAHITLPLHQLYSSEVFDHDEGQAFYNRSGIFSAFDGMTYRPYKYVDEAHVTLGNLHKHPAYFRMGLGRVPFGLYDRNEILVNYTTLFTEIQTVFAQVGFMDASGFFGSGYIFRGLSKASDLNTSDKDGEGHKWDNDGNVNINNGGVSLGYCKNNGNNGFKFVADWLYNYAGALNMVRALTAGRDAFGNTSYHNEVMGLHIGFKGHYNQFDYRANFVTAMKKFHKDAFIFAGYAPRVISGEAGVHYKMGQKASRFAVGYQQTLNLKAAAMPDEMMASIINKSMVTAEVTTEVVKNVTAGVHYALEVPYKDARIAGKRMNNIHTVMISLTTKIA